MNHALIINFCFSHELMFSALIFVNLLTLRWSFLFFDLLNLRLAGLGLTYLLSLFVGILLWLLWSDLLLNILCDWLLLWNLCNCLRFYLDLKKLLSQWLEFLLLWLQTLSLLWLIPLLPIIEQFLYSLPVTMGLNQVKGVLILQSLELGVSPMI